MPKSFGFIWHFFDTEIFRKWNTSATHEKCAKSFFYKKKFIEILRKMIKSYYLKAQIICLLEKHHLDFLSEDLNRIERQNTEKLIINRWSTKEQMKACWITFSDNVGIWESTPSTFIQSELGESSEETWKAERFLRRSSHLNTWRLFDILNKTPCTLKDESFQMLNSYRSSITTETFVILLSDNVGMLKSTPLLRSELGWSSNLHLFNYKKRLRISHFDYYSKGNIRWKPQLLEWNINLWEWITNWRIDQIVIVSE